jgi:hypothetical protein
MSVHSLHSRLKKAEEQLANQMPPKPEVDNRPPVPLFVRVAVRDVLHSWEGPEEPAFVAVMAQLPAETHDRMLEWVDLTNPGWWLDDGLGHIDEEQLPADATEVVAGMYQQQQPPPTNATRSG